jgi:hypothetical protein
MLDPFDKADHWRSRAEELRAIADATREPDARAGLLAIAGGLEHHARSLEDMAVTLHCTDRVFRANATEVVTEPAE